MLSLPVHGQSMSLHLGPLWFLSSSFSNLQQGSSMYRILCLMMWGGADVIVIEINESESPSVMSDSLQPHGLYSSWNSPGQNTEVGSLSLLQGIFLTQGLNPGVPYCRQILYQLSHNKRNKVHNKCNLLESSQNHLTPPPPATASTWSMGKLSSMKLVSGAKMVGDYWYSVHKSYTCFVKHIPKYFIFFGETVNDTVFLILVP